MDRKQLNTTIYRISLVPLLSLLVAPLDSQAHKRSEPDNERETKRANILIILTDDQGYGDLSCHGNPVLRTPNLDHLHSQAVRLTEFHVSGISTPTRSQLLTGVDNLRNRACQWGYGLEFMRRDIPTMAEIFSSTGYRTGLFGKWHLGDIFPHRPGDRGFQESVRFGGASIQQTPDHWDSDGFDDFYWHNDVWKQYKGYCTDIFFDEAMRFMRECHRNDMPFLAFIPTGAVHDPCFVDNKYRKPYMKIKFRGQPLPENVHSYFGMVSNLDMNIGRLEKFLKAEGLRENTIMIFMSDNGGVQGVPIYDAGMSGTKGSLLEGGHRQTCFIRWPAGKLRQAGDVGGLTQIQDLLPTLLDLTCTGMSRQVKFDGISLAPLLRGQDQDLGHRMLVVQWGWGAKGQGTVLWQHWRLTGGKDGWQLHNLENDPYQKTDVLADHPYIAARMQEQYETWWRDIEPALGLYECPHIGDPKADPLTLTCFDYISHKFLRKGYFNVCLQSCVRKGVGVHGKWRLHAVSAGNYQISLRRWPAEADAAITAGLPLQELTDPYPEDLPDRRLWYDTPQVGVALPIVSAKVRLGEKLQTAVVGRDDKVVSFVFSLPSAGDVELETWFFDIHGEEICSAPYVEIKKLQTGTTF